jgi:hypothetical protein
MAVPPSPMMRDLSWRSPARWVALFWKEFIPDVARRWCQTNTSRLSPSCLIDFLFVADCQATCRLRCDEDRVTHFPAGKTVLGFNFFPKPKASKFESRKFFFDLPAQAIFIAFLRSLAPSGKTSKVHRAFVLRAAPGRVSQPPVSRTLPFSISTICISTICRTTAS